MSCRSCASGYRCGHGTEAEGRPSLLAIGVVSRILERAVGNVMRRAQAAASGEMTEEEVNISIKLLKDLIDYQLAMLDAHPVQG